MADTPRVKALLDASEFGYPTTASPTFQAMRRLACELECELAAALAKVRDSGIAYSPCEKHRGMSMVFTATVSTRAPVCPGCYPPPNLVTDVPAKGKENG